MNCRINRNLASARLDEYQRETQALHDHTWDARCNKDQIYKAALHRSIDQVMRSSDLTQEQQIKLRSQEVADKDGVDFDAATEAKSGCICAIE